MGQCRFEDFVLARTGLTLEHVQRIVARNFPHSQTVKVLVTESYVAMMQRARVAGYHASDNCKYGGCLFCIDWMSTAPVTRKQCVEEIAEIVEDILTKV